MVNIKNDKVAIFSLAFAAVIGFFGIYTIPKGAPLTGSALTDSGTTSHEQSLTNTYTGIIRRHYAIPTPNGHRLVFKNYGEYKSYRTQQSAAKQSITFYKENAVIPDDLKDAVLFAQTVLGVPYNVLLMTAYEESRFQGNSINQNSSGRGYFHTLKDTKFELIQKTVDTPLERLFPLAKYIVTAPSGHLYLSNSKTGEIDKAKTMAYHEQIAKDPYLSAIIAGLKILEDKRILTRKNIPGTTLDTRAQYWLGSWGGRTYAQLRRTNPNVPIWRVYGTDKETVLKQYKKAIYNDGNKDFFFLDRDAGLFRTVAQNKHYLKHTKEIPDESWQPQKPDYKLAKNLRLNADQSNELDALTTKHARRMGIIVEVASLDNSLR